MTDAEPSAAKAIVLRNPTRPRYRDDTTIIVRGTDLPPEQRVLVERLALEVGAVVRRATVSELRESESVPLIGDTEFEFSIASLE